MKIKINSDDNLPLNKTLKLCYMTIDVFEEHGKFYSQVYLDDCLYELCMLKYDKIGVSQGIDINKINASKECKI